MANQLSYKPKESESIFNKIRIRIFFIFFLIINVKAIGIAATFNFIGGNAGNIYSDPSNWENNEYPGSFLCNYDVVNINAFCVMDVPITNIGATINFSANCTIQETFSNERSMMVAENITITPLDFFTNRGNIYMLKGSRIRSNITNFGSLEITGKCEFSFSLFNYGAIRIGDTLTLANSSRINNYGLVENSSVLVNNGIIDDRSNHCHILNRNIFSKIINNGMISFKCRFDNLGTIENIGTINNDGGTFTNHHLFQNFAGSSFTNNELSRFDNLVGADFILDMNSSFVEEEYSHLIIRS